MEANWRSCHWQEATLNCVSIAIATNVGHLLIVFPVEPRNRGVEKTSSLSRPGSNLGGTCWAYLGCYRWSATRQSSYRAVQCGTPARKRSTKETRLIYAKKNGNPRGDVPTFSCDAPFHTHIKSACSHTSEVGETGKTSANRYNYLKKALLLNSSTSFGREHVPAVTHRPSGDRKFLPSSRCSPVPQSRFPIGQHNISFMVKINIMLHSYVIEHFHVARRYPTIVHDRIIGFWDISIQRATREITSQRPNIRN